MKILPVIKALKPQIIYVVSIITILILLPNKTFISILSAIYACTVTYKLIQEISWSKKPNPREWVYTSLKTMLFASLLLGLYMGAGFFGIFGLLALVILISGWRIYNGWHLFDAVTSWGADRLRGRTKEDFDFEKVINDEQQRRTIKESNGQDSLEQRGQGSYELDKEQPREPPSFPKDYKASLPPLPSFGVSKSSEGDKGGQEPVVRFLPKNLGVRRKPIKGDG